MITLLDYMCSFRRSYSSAFNLHYYYSTPFLGDCINAVIFFHVWLHLFCSCIQRWKSTFCRILKIVSTAVFYFVLILFFINIHFNDGCTLLHPDAVQ